MTILYGNYRVLDPGQVPKIKGFTRSRSVVFRHFHFGIVFISVDFPHMSWCCPVLSTIYRLHCQLVLEQKNGAHITISVGLYTSFIMGLKPYSVLSACRARGRVCLEQLVIHQVVWIAYLILHPKTRLWVFFKVKTTLLFTKTSSQTKPFRMVQSHPTSTNS